MSVSETQCLAANTGSKFAPFRLTDFCNSKIKYFFVMASKLIRI